MNWTASQDAARAAVGTMANCASSRDKRTNRVKTFCFLIDILLQKNRNREFKGLTVRRYEWFQCLIAEALQVYTGCSIYIVTKRLQPIVSKMPIKYLPICN